MLTLSTLLRRTVPAPNGCQVIGKPSKRRYWSMKFNGLRTNAHRVAWILAYGPVPSGQCVLHTCDNTRCINPAHLFLGTQADNANDRDAKGRNGTLGEKSPLAKLTADKVLSIFGDPEPASAIARKFEVSKLTVQRIKLRQTWKHILRAA